MESINELLSTEEGRKEFRRLTNERLPKVLALKEKFGCYILQDHPEAMDMYEELMREEISEPYKTIEKEYKEWKKNREGKN